MNVSNNLQQRSISEPGSVPPETNDRSSCCQRLMRRCKSAAETLFSSCRKRPDEGPAEPLSHKTEKHAQFPKILIYPVPPLDPYALYDFDPIEEPPTPTYEELGLDDEPPTPRYEELYPQDFKDGVLINEAPAPAKPAPEPNASQEEPPTPRYEELYPQDFKDGVLINEAPSPAVCNQMQPSCKKAKRLRSGYMLPPEGAPSIQTLRSGRRIAYLPELVSLRRYFPPAEKLSARAK